MTDLRSYMAWAAETREEAACLVFANTAKEARKVAWPTLRVWWEDVAWIDVRARRLHNDAYFFQQADAEKLSQDIPHVIEAPKTCRSCEQWGVLYGDSCIMCMDEWENDNDE